VDIIQLCTKEYVCCSPSRAASTVVRYLPRHVQISPSVQGLETLEIPIIDPRARRPRNTRLSSIPPISAALRPLRRRRLIRRRLRRLLGRSLCGLDRWLGGSRRGSGRVLRATVRLELRPELPRVARREGGVAPLVGLAGVVVAIENDPRGRLAGQASGVLGLGGAAAVRLGLGREAVAAVVGDEAVAHLAALGDGEDRVACAVLVVVCHRLGAARAAGEDGRRQNRHGAHVVGARARPRVGHRAAVGEAGGKAQRLLNAEVGFDGSHDAVDEADVLAAAVGPAVADAVRGDEDGAVVARHERGQAVVGEGAAATVGDLLVVTAESVEGEDEAVGLVGVIVVGETNNVLSVLPVDVGGVLPAVADRGCLAAPG